MSGRNGSELGTVPNSSERSPGARKPAGRPPLVSDDELIEIVEALESQSGQIPTLDEIGKASGGCQRARAVAARRAVVAKRADRELSALLHVPEEIEKQHRQLMVKWMSIARQQLDVVLAEQVSEAQERVDLAEDAARDARGRSEACREEVLASVAEIEHLQQVNLRLEKRLARLERSESRWKTLAQERDQVLKRVTAASNLDDKLVSPG